MHNTKPEPRTVHPSHHRARDVAYHDVVDALAFTRWQSAHALRVATGLTAREVGRALRLLQRDKLIERDGNRYRIGGGS